MADESKIFKLQLLSDEVVRNPKLNSKAFVAFAKLCEMYGKSKNDILEVDHKAFKGYLSVSDNRSFKAVLHNLYENNLILNEIETLPRRSALEIHINKDMTPLHNKNMFTQLDIRLLDKKILDEIGTIGIRLMYYYESRINRLELHKDHAYASIETISKDTGFAKDTIGKYNEILEKRKLIWIKKFKLEHVGWYDEGNYIDFARYANHTYVKVGNIPKLLTGLYATSSF
ncbi:hypothetical protein [Halalkalibacter alkalisediminis]|uniref:Uncharacterized protein n=1 Tax=Halalkalibacter alkalisediminis TaxID=935616 RepID=A0ABV6NHN8_9BACI|nr:hypothetical protein [Halalkalibacter alkalisediminis]